MDIFFWAFWCIQRYTLQKVERGRDRERQHADDDDDDDEKMSIRVDKVVILESKGGQKQGGEKIWIEVEAVKRQGQEECIFEIKLASSSCIIFCT